jgi:hypothetical protein
MYAIKLTRALWNNCLVNNFSLFLQKSMNDDTLAANAGADLLTGMLL